MRLIHIVLILLFIAVGACFGTLNDAPVRVDLYVAQVSLPLGMALLGCAAAGWLLGGAVSWGGQVPRLRRDLRAAKRELEEARAKGIDENRA